MMWYPIRHYNTHFRNCIWWHRSVQVYDTCSTIHVAWSAKATDTFRRAYLHFRCNTDRPPSVMLQWQWLSADMARCWCHVPNLQMINAWQLMLHMYVVRGLLQLRRGNHCCRCRGPFESGRMIHTLHFMSLGLNREVNRQLSNLNDTAHSMLF